MLSALACFLSAAGWSAGTSLAVAQDTNQAPVDRPVTVADAIGMTMVAWAGDKFDGAELAGRRAHYSPDGSQFVVVVRKGNLQTNTNDYSVLLWRTRDVLQPPAPTAAPTAVLTMRSSSARPAIQGVTWLPDNETLAFLGERPGELQQLYTFNTRTHVLRRLTHHATNLISYSIIGHGEQFAFAAERPAETLFDEPARHHGIVLAGQRLADLLRGVTSQGRFEGEAQIFVHTRAHGLRRVTVPGRVPIWREAPSLSPNGRYLLIASNVAHPPTGWREYTSPEIREMVAGERLEGENSVLARYLLIDLMSGVSRVLIDAPLQVHPWSEVAWAPDGRSVVIAGTYLPLEGATGTERELRRSSLFAVEVSVPSGALDEISHDDVQLLRWDPGTRDVVFAPGKWDEPTQSGAEAFFQKRGGKWERVPDELVASQTRPQIVTEQSMTTPPRLVVSTLTPPRRTVLLDLNPQFQRLKFGRVEEIQWTGTDGTPVKGGLYYPVNYTPGHRYPLVIQTNGWLKSEFWMSGPYETTAFAAQALAGAGIMVLQAEQSVAASDKWFDNVRMTLKEAPTHQAIYEGAIDYLDHQGLIDRHRVGIIGFSRTSYYVKYALTHSTYRFAAASVTDGVDAGYFQYMAFWDEQRPFAEAMNGAPPFAGGLKHWMERAPGFNTEKVTTPLRIMSLDHVESLLNEWEWFVALRRQQKPVEMVTLEEDDHPLQKPWNRLVSQAGTVDWFRFWLQGEEDPDPAKREQYARWRDLLRLLQLPQVTPDTGAAEPGAR